MKTDYCAYPPQLAADVEITEQRDGDRTVYIAGSAAVGRYLLLRRTEHQVVSLIDESRTVAEVCDEFSRATGAALKTETLVRFLTKLDEYGILAGERSQGSAAPDSPLSQMHYIRFKLFNPDKLFAVLVSKLRRVWTTGFLVISACTMLLVTLFALMNREEVASYGESTLREHFVAIFIAAWLVGVTHEFAHGTTCKAFGGRATEVGVLMVYYFLPALYCNVSGIHLIPTRGRRLWVIAAGVYWQLMVGAAAMLAWFLLAPHTLASDIAFIILLGSVLDVFFNANPLIKLDGYYFLSQWLRLPNLMDRSRAYWRGVLKRILFGEPNAEAARYGRRERMIYLVFGLLSFVYNLAFASLIVIFVGGWLVERFYLPGLLMAVAIALVFMRRAIRQIFNTVAFRANVLLRGREAKMAEENQTKTEDTGKSARVSGWRRRVVPAAIALAIMAVLLMPWSASVGNYRLLIALPNREAIIRAPESATLVTLRVQPGDSVAEGAVIGQMGNFDLEEQIVEVQADLARANSDYDRLLGELRAREEAASRAGMQLEQRRIEYDEIDTERRQIAERRRSEAGASKFVTVSRSRANDGDVRYPAALAALQAEVEAFRAQVEEADSHRLRARTLYADGIAARSELDSAEARAATLAGAMAAAREQLDAALVEHRRKHTSATTGVNLARSDVISERMQIAGLGDELAGTRELIRTLESRRDLLLRKRSQFDLVTKHTGAVFGEDLQRTVGQFFQKGAEICRIADTSQLLLRIQVPEREIGDVQVGHPVRLKTRSFPNRVFHGVVSKIGGESEIDQHSQATYRVELTIENKEGWLRPGMTAFARIDFDRQPVARIFLHKIKQSLRPELWML